jgi:tetratricopeptide (TPR) repeat protein
LSARTFGNHVAAARSQAEAMPLWRRALELYEEVGDREGMGVVVSSMGTALVEDGMHHEGIALLRRATSLFEEIGHGGYLVEAVRELAAGVLEAGDIGEAETHALRAFGMAADDDPGSGASTRMVLGQVRAAQMRDDEAEALLKEAIGMIEGTDYRLAHSECYLAYAEFLLSRGRSSEGESFGEKARAVVLPMGEQSEAVRYIDRRLAAAREVSVSAR